MVSCSWLFHRVAPEDNELRFYYIAVQPSLLDSPGQWSVLRIYGRMGDAQQEMAPVQFSNKKSAINFALQLIEKRLRRGYVLMEYG